MILTRNFEKWEFDSKDGAPMPFEVLAKVKVVAQQLQIVRDELSAINGYDTLIGINSGYRSRSHNANVGGSKNSYHLKGMAADIIVEGMDPIDLGSFITSLMIQRRIEQGGLGIYPNFVHYDIRGTFIRFR